MIGTIEAFKRQYITSSSSVYGDVIDTAGAAYFALQGIADVTPGMGQTFGMQLQHSNVNEDSTFTNLGSQVNINNGDTTKFVFATQFGRYVRLKLVPTGGVAGYFRGVACLKESN